MTYNKLSHWLPIIRDWERSGLSISAFCRREGLRPNYFHNRRAALKSAGLWSPSGSEKPPEQAVAERPGFSAVSAPISTGGRMAMQVGSARLIFSDIPSPGWLADVLQAVDS